MRPSTSSVRSISTFSACTPWEGLLDDPVRGAAVGVPELIRDLLIGVALGGELYGAGLASLGQGPVASPSARSQRAALEAKLTARRLHGRGAGVDLPEYKRRREALQQEVEQARTRLAELDEPEMQAPTTATVTRFADAWPTLSVDARRDAAEALLTAVRVHPPNKTVELVPRWGKPVTITTLTHCRPSRTSAMHLPVPCGRDQ